MFFVGATVHLVCRNAEKGEAAKQELITESKNEVTLPLPPSFPPSRPLSLPLSLSLSPSFSPSLSPSHPLFTASLYTLQKIFLHLLDLSQPKDVIKFTKEFIQSGQRLDVLVRYNMLPCALEPWLYIVMTTSV